jgi:hypothetical protein
MNIINLEKTENEDGSISLPFSVSNETYTLSDAIVGNPDYISGLNLDQIIEIQQQRFTNWLAIING